MRSRSAAARVPRPNQPPTAEGAQHRVSVLDRKQLEDSPLADLHAIASELGIEGYRRLRKAELIDLILGGEAAEEQAASSTPPSEGTGKQQATADVPEAEPA